MKKTNTYTKTITTEELFCDICGKRLSKKEEKCWPPYAVLHYVRFYNGKAEDNHEEYWPCLELCEECNSKVVGIVLHYFDEFTQKASAENLVKFFKEK